jgi:hypothetical protein
LRRIDHLLFEARLRNYLKHSPFCGWLLDKDIEAIDAFWRAGSGHKAAPKSDREKIFGCNEASSFQRTF